MSNLQTKLHNFVSLHSAGFWLNFATGDQHNSILTGQRAALMAERNVDKAVCHRTNKS